MDVQIQNEQEFPANAVGLQKAAEVVLARHEKSNVGMTIVVTDNEAVATLNRRYRGIDAPTDVLSFPADAPPVTIPDEPVYLGDLVIAFPYAAAQAEREGHPLDDSLCLLVVHATLHLLGYDHDTPENKADMWAEQEAILSALHISPEIVPALEGDPHV
jgi:probable rRNA maturation factor